LKTRISTLIIFFIALSAFLLSAVKKEPGELTITTPLRLGVPKGWPKPLNIFAYNPLTEEGFDLMTSLPHAMRPDYLILPGFLCIIGMGALIILKYSHYRR